MKNYYALIIDVVSSRKLSDNERFDLQKKLADAIVVVNKVFEDKIIKVLSFSAGDSVQGLFDSISSAYEAFLLIKNAVYPHVIRAGIGYGTINQIMLEEFNDLDSNRYDGQAYHRAKSAVDLAKRNKNNIIINTEKDYDKSINPIIDDEQIITITQSRRAIYSLINLIDPIIEDESKPKIEYYKVICPIVTTIVNQYRKQSRVNKVRNAIDIENEIFKNKLSEIEVYEYLAQYYKHSDNISVRYRDDLSTISTQIRSLLVNLIGSKEQNVNALIRTSHMDHLRRRNIARIEIIKDLYKEY